ncbi:hypothetical protein N7474_010122 [Penicillium riverlandense]|uniref:uncharacterized protein n=1 Tax=Penicillium riverlandense TaxID=1903569 RepID=UPI002546E6F8|nr:uncharacterized protein N7474_010122 [Penicillium riverlandense]KAJ5808853.1 hypothetical protein N7474_010122 [Penicillium riverlandense]
MNMGEFDAREITALPTFFNNSGALPWQPEDNRLGKKLHAIQNQQPSLGSNPQIPKDRNQKQLSSKKIARRKKPNSRQRFSSTGNWSYEELESLLPFIEARRSISWRDKVKLWNKMFGTNRSPESLRGQYNRITGQGTLVGALVRPLATRVPAEASHEPRMSSVGRSPTSASASHASRLAQRIDLSGTRGINSDSKIDSREQLAGRVAPHAISDCRKLGSSHVFTISELLSTSDPDEGVSKGPVGQEGEAFSSPHQHQASLPRMDEEISQQAHATPHNPLLSNPAYLCLKTAQDDGCERPSGPIFRPMLAQPPSPGSGRSSTANQSLQLQSSPSQSLASSWTSRMESIQRSNGDKLQWPDDSCAQLYQTLHEQLWEVLETQSGPPQTPARQDQEAQIVHSQRPARQDRATQTDLSQNLEPQSLVLQEKPLYEDPPEKGNGYPAKRQKKNCRRLQPLDVSLDRNSFGHSSASTSSSQEGTWRDWVLGGLWGRGNGRTI